MFPARRWAETEMALFNLRLNGFYLMDASSCAAGFTGQGYGGIALNRAD